RKRMNRSGGIRHAVTQEHSLSAGPAAVELKLPRGRVARVNVLERNLKTFCGVRDVRLSVSTHGLLTTARRPYCDRGRCRQSTACVPPAPGTLQSPGPPSRYPTL